MWEAGDVMEEEDVMKDKLTRAMTPMSYESRRKDPATRETSMAWHLVERSMSTIFKCA